MAKITLTKEDRKEVAAKLAEAAYHMAACWDALREIEDMLGVEVETEQIEGLASECGCPADYPNVDGEYLDTFLADLETA